VSAAIALMDDDWSAGDAGGLTACFDNDVAGLALVSFRRQLLMLQQECGRWDGALDDQFDSAVHVMVQSMRGFSRWQV
jgi:hypothetical protein